MARSLTFVFMSYLASSSYFFITDSTYTERYMSLPSTSDNFLNYNKASVLNKAVNMKGKKFLLVHGTADGKLQHSTCAMVFSNRFFRGFDC